MHIQIKLESHKCFEQIAFGIKREYKRVLTIWTNEFEGAKLGKFQELINGEKRGEYFIFVFLGLIRFQSTKTKHEDSTND